MTATPTPLLIPSTTKTPFHNRLSYLVTSAHLLAATSPAAAAHLLQTCHAKVWEKEAEVMLSRGSAGLGGSSMASGGGGGAGGGCKRCGGVWVLGLNCGVGGGRGVVKMGVKKKEKKKGKEGIAAKEEKRGKGVGAKGGRGEKWVEWECGMCGYIAKGEISSRKERGSRGGGRDKNEARIGKERVHQVQQQQTVVFGIGNVDGKEIDSATVTAKTLMMPPSSDRSTTQQIQTQDQGQVQPVSRIKAITAAPAAPPVKEQVQASTTTTPTLQTANKRAKERKKKKNNSLQEMLAAKRERESAANGIGKGGIGGIDLMDLMKLG